MYLHKYDDYFLVPILNAHGVEVQSPIVVDSRTNLNLVWDPANILPSEDDPNSFTVDATVYSYDYDGNVWVMRSRRKNLPNNGI